MKHLLVGLFGFFVTYLLSSFYNVTFNIANWSEYSRFITMLFGAMIGVVSAWGSKIYDINK